MRNRRLNNASNNMRKFLKRQGYVDIHIISFGGERVQVSYYDPFGDHYFCMVYSLQDLLDICHVNDIYWRYVK